MRSLQRIPWITETVTKSELRTVLHLSSLEKDTPGATIRSCTYSHNKMFIVVVYLASNINLDRLID